MRGPNEDMDNQLSVPLQGLDSAEIQEWLESLDSVLQSSGPEVASYILERLRAHAKVVGIDIPFTANTPYVNTIPASLQPELPGDQHLERRIKSLVRWNAMAMVVRANREEHGIGGHISTYASAATLYELGSIIFSGRARRSLKATRFIFRGMLRRAFMRAHFWKGGCRRRSWKISGAN